MPEHAPNQQVAPRGFTLLEMIVALAIMAVTATALVGLFRAAITTSLFNTRQTFILSNSRKALKGDGSALGVQWAILDSTTVYNLSSSNLSISLSDGTSTTYSVSGDNLYRASLFSNSILAKGITGLQVNYYNLDTTGRIVVSTAPQNAALVTAAFTLKGKLSRETTYYFYTGAWRRNQ